MEQAAFNPEQDARMAIANSVAAELARHRYSKRAAALKLGMTPLYLYRRLNGEVEFGGTDLLAIAEMLGISAGAFFPGNEKTPPAAKGEGRNARLEGLEPPTFCLGAEIVQLDTYRTTQPIVAELTDSTAVISAIR